MKTALLEQLMADRDAARAVVLARDLATGDAALLYPEDSAHLSFAGYDLSEDIRTAVRADRSGPASSAGGAVFLHVFNPPLRMLIVGAVHIAQTLSAMATLAGYTVTVIDPRRAFATAKRFPDVRLETAWPDEALDALAPDARTAVVTLTHDPKLDDPALAAALASDAFYIGSLGSRKTHAARCERLKKAGFTSADIDRIHGPVGLAIGARAPAEIAIAIMAQITEKLRLTVHGD